MGRAGLIAKLQGIYWAGFRRRVTPEIKWLGIGGAAGMAFIDFYYSLNDMILNIYMLDGIAEIILILLWGWVGRQGIAQVASPDLKRPERDV